MSIIDVERELKEARDKVTGIEREFAAMVRMIDGQLRKAHATDPNNWSRTTGALRRLKRELQDFDSRTGHWRVRE